MRVNPTIIIVVSLCSIVFCFSSSIFAHIGPHKEIGLINKKLKQDPNNRDLLLKRAFLFRLIGHHQDALNELNKLIKKYPEDTACYFQRALTYKGLKAYQRAESDLTRIIQLGGKDAKVFSEQAAIRETLKRFQAALDDYQSGARYRQTEDFYIRFGRLHQRLGRYQDAADAFRKGLKQWPSSIVLTRALVRLEISRANYEQAHQLVTAALQKRRFKTPRLLLKGEVYEAAGQKEKAMKTLQEALKECKSKINAGRGSAIHRTYLAEVLLAMGDLEGANREVKTVLQKFPDYFRAIELKQRIEFKQSVVKGDADVSAKGEYSDTLLHEAASQGDAGIVKVLLEAGADVNAKNKDGAMPLHRAVDAGHLQIVKLLTKAGADVNATDKDNNLPLHIASFLGNAEIVKVLLEAGGEVNVKNRQGETPLEKAANADIAELLRQAGAKVDKSGGSESGRQQK